MQRVAFGALAGILSSLLAAASAGGIDCPAPCNDNNFCTTESCNTATGQCQTSSTVTCNDTNECTTESCNTASGLCETTSTRMCRDTNACTTEVCNTTTGACDTPNTLLCNDGSGCTTESCNTASGLCETTSTEMCGDTNACTVESCNTASGQCQTTATVQCPDPMCQLCDPSVGCKAREPLPLGCNAPPVCSQALAEPGELWPPRRRFFSDVSVAGVTDPDGDPVSITITGITQDEPLQGLRGAGRRCPDADGAGTATASLRTERIGRRDGRVYHISFTAADGRGGTCAGLVTVCVPHDQRLGHVCIDQGPLVDSTGPCS